MSNSLLAFISLAGTFGAVAIAGIALQFSRAERMRTADLVRSQVGTAPPDLRKQNLSRPFIERVLFPVGLGLGGVARRLTPIDMRKRIEKKLTLAGSPAGWDADRVAGLKLVGIGVGAAAGYLFAKQLGFQGVRFIGFMALVTVAGYLAPDSILSRKAEDRQKQIRKAMPDTMDLLTISVEAGLGFDAALAQVVQHVPGPLSLELARMLQEVQLGRSRADAFRELAARSDVEEMSAFTLAMIQADVFGVSVSKVLRAQAKELRAKRRQSAERIAMQIPVKILFPMLFCVMPALFVVVIGPGALRIFDAFFKGGGF
jgi:tight adherence protein C